MKSRRYLFIFGILFLGLIVAAIGAIMIGPVFIHPLEVAKIWLHKLSGGLIESNWSSVQETIVIEIRSPRVILAILVGMGLAISGAAMQGLFRNPMADPYILGMSSGAACGAAIAIVLGIGKVFGTLAIPALAFIGAITAISMVCSIARTEGRMPTEALILSGIAVGCFLHAGVSFLKIISTDHQLRSIVLWLMGSFSAAGWSDVKMVSLPIIGGLIVLYLLSRELNILQFGEEQALHLGVEVEKIKIILLITASLMTAVCVCASGIIGFIGLVIPHMMRLITGPNHHILLPVSLLAGGIFLVLCDTLARTIGGAIEIPIGIITAVVGAPYLIYLLKRRKKAISWW